MKKNSKAIIGILTTPGANDGLRPLFKENERLGNILYRFTPKDILLQQRRIKGYTLTRSGRWDQKVFAWPNLVIDKSFDAKYGLYGYVKRNSFFPFTEHTIGGKWDIHRMLWKVEELRPFLPETCTYSGSNLNRMLQKYKLLYIKPIDGTWGLGILKVQRRKKGYLVVGRDIEKGIVRYEIPDYEILSWVQKWVGQSPFVIQQGLNLNLLPNKVTDMRVLIQKNRKGKWSITGQGMRVGGSKSPISNLHGGGMGKGVRTFLEPILGSQRVNHILYQSHWISHVIAEVIERKYGRMMELGLDFGIDTKGQLWIIEVNDMPGRNIFRHMGREDLFRKANRKPLQYAMYLIRNGYV